MDGLSLRRLVTRLVMLTVVMFAFGFALVPIYDVMCKAFGINGNLKHGLAGLFMSHPPLEDRIEALRAAGR